MSIFGNIVSAEHVENAVLNHLKLWLDTYLAEVERQRSLDEGSIPRPRSWTVTSDFDDPWPEHQLPAVFVISPGLWDEPSLHGKGYRSQWSVGVACVVKADNRVNTRRLANRYISSIRACLVQHRSLGGFASGLDWVDEELTDVPTVQSRTLASGQAVFVVTVDSTVMPTAGPATPTPKPDPHEPYEDWPQVQTTHLDVEALE